VAALGSYLDARHHRGDWLLRIEDLDPPREKPGAAAEILRTLEAFGFEWDGEVVYQSRRQSAYRHALENLQRHGLTYPCACTRREIDAAALSGIEGPRYPGTCRDGLPASRAPRAIRIRTDDTPFTFTDRICGPIRMQLEKDLGDFVIRRADGLFAYQLAVVVDDAFQGINQVVRGADLLLSTPRQIMLQQRLGLPTPDYAHLPLVVDSRGKKLSKQSDARPVDARKPLPALLAAAEFLNQPLPPEPPRRLDEFWSWTIQHWDASRIPSTPLPG